MANCYAGLDPTLAHLPTPAPSHAAAIHYCSARAAAFENEALTSALRASMAPVHGSAAAVASTVSSFCSPATPSFSTPATPSSSTSTASELLSSGHDAPTPASASCRSARPPARALKGPKGGGVSKRKPRPSRAAPTTYIAADPANFRRLVQEITGLSSSSSFPGVSEAAAAAAAPAWMPAPAYVLPTLDTSAFLLDHATTPTPEEKSSSCPASATTAPATTVAAADDSSLLMEMDAMTDFFPTLESWGII